MDLQQAKNKFIQLWGTVGVDWGINRTMAQIHAVLLISEIPLSTEDVMEALKISRGNANMNLRELVNWQLVTREHISGDRKEYFVAQKDIWQVARQIVIERRKRELDPMMKCLDDILNQTKAKSSEIDEEKKFKKLLSDIYSLGRKSNSLLDLVLKLDQNSFFKPLTKFLKL